METLNKPVPAPSSPAQNMESAPTLINPVSMATNPLGMPGINLDPGLASRLQQSAKTGRRLNLKLIIIVGFVPVGFFILVFD